MRKTLTKTQTWDLQKKKQQQMLQGLCCEFQIEIKYATDFYILISLEDRRKTERETINHAGSGNFNFNTSA